MIERASGVQWVFRGFSVGFQWVFRGKGQFNYSVHLFIHFMYLNVLLV